MVDKHGLRDHPGIKAIIMIGGLIADAACDEKLDGLCYSSNLFIILEEKEQDHITLVVSF